MFLFRFQKNKKTTSSFKFILAESLFFQQFSFETTYRESSFYQHNMTPPIFLQKTGKSIFVFFSSIFHP